MILKKTLAFYGVKSDSEVREFQKVMQVLMAMQAAQQMGAGAGVTATAGGPAQATTGTPSAAPMGLQ